MTATLLVPRIDTEISEVVQLGLVQAEGVQVLPSAGFLPGEIEKTCSVLVTEHRGKSPSEIPGLAPARELYRAFGIDPTKTRPSSEAMLRRLLKDKPFPRINNAVDLCNLFALRFLLSLGLYDADKIEGTVALRRGREGESFAGIRKNQVNVSGRIVLADDGGPFGNPTSDSLRTSVGEGTTRLWMVLFAPASFPRDRLDSHIEECRSDMARFLSPPEARAVTGGMTIP